ncbi:MAG: hypothetical protein ICV51_13935 [Flavisolibacter sp.]|nr:hypothetical protein [Flavisolibacter sp.]
MKNILVAEILPNQYVTFLKGNRSESSLYLKDTIFRYNNDNGAQKLLQ